MLQRENRSPAGPGPSRQASKGWISSKRAPLGWRSGKGEGKQRELGAFGRLEIVKLKMFDLITVTGVNLWEHGDVFVCRGQGRAPKAPSPRGPEPSRMGMDTARGVWEAELGFGGSGLGMRDRRGQEGTRGWGGPGQVPAEPLVLLGWLWLCREGLGSWASKS